MLRIIATITLLLLTQCVAYATPEIQINLPEYKLKLIDNETIIAAYDIAIGAVTDAAQTPVGMYQITEKESDPTWYPTDNQRANGAEVVGPGPDNPLGTRWLGFAGVYGIHGTNMENLVGFGYAVSDGCIRMHNRDAQDLYARVDIGTPVTIIYQTILISEKKDGLYVKILPDVYGRNTTTTENFKRALGDAINTYHLTQLNLPLVINQEVKLATLSTAK